MRSTLLDVLSSQTESLRRDGLFKSERVLSSPQAPRITLQDGSQVLNFCANNYLGLADDPRLIAVAHRALDDHGVGMASVRFICGTADIHVALEQRVSAFLQTEDTILYSSCFDANGGLFETIFDDSDVIISDSLNHASIIDGIRLSKAGRLRYANNDMVELEQRLQESAGARYRLIVTDGVFSMDGVIANLTAICDLAERYNALVAVDDSHAVGLVGASGRGTPELLGVSDQVDILTGTFGKALGGSAGGYTSGRKEIIGWLRQRSRPYLFSNSIPPVVAAVTLAAIDLAEHGTELRLKLHHNALRFREGMTRAGFQLAGAGHPIVPVMLGDAVVANEMARRLLDLEVYAIAFAYPVVPAGAARIRIQLSASHTDDQVDRAIAAFTSVGRSMGVVA